MRRVMYTVLGALVALVLAMAVVFPVSAVPPDSVIDFETGLAEGDIVSSVSCASGIDCLVDPGGFVTVFGANPDLGGNQAMIFDATCQPGGDPTDCTGGDFDLFQPLLINVLIISEDNDSSDPDDGNVVGSMFEFDFSNWGFGTVEVFNLDALDIEAGLGEGGAKIDVFSGGCSGVLLKSVGIPDTGQGGLVNVAVNQAGVDCMIVTLNGSGAIDNIAITPEVPDIDIRKQAEGPDSRTVQSGSDVTFAIVVTNTGDVDLVNVEVTDAQVPGCARFIGNLAVGGSVSYDCTAPNVIVGFVNEACVMGEDDSNNHVEDCDPSTVEVAGIHIEKFTLVQEQASEICTSKPVTLTMLYTGDDAGATSHSQDSSKVNVDGDPAFATPVDILAIDKENPSDRRAKVFFDGQVILDTTFIIDAANAGENKLKAKTFVFIYSEGGELLQTIEFHTSCSQPLFLGNQFGGVQLVGFTDEDGNSGSTTSGGSGFGEDADTPTGPTATVGDTIVWTYVVTNTGDTRLSDIVVVDNNGTPGDTSDDFNPLPIEESGFNVGDLNTDNFLDLTEEWLFRATGVAGAGQYANIGKVTGTPVGGGADVMDDDPSHYIAELVQTNLCTTFGKPTILIMLYTGDGDDATSHSQDSRKVNVDGDPNNADPVRILVTDKNNPSDNRAKVFFDGQVALGETFTIDADAAGENKLKAKTFVFIYDGDDNLLQTIEFHTSCSQPLFLGNQFGGVQLVGFTDEHGNGV